MTPAALLEAILSEVRAVRASQHEMMRLLKSGAAAAAPADVPYMELGSDDLDDSPAPTRSRRRKTVLLIDDDPETLQDAVAALDRVEVPVRSTQDGNEALALIASEKPDVILLELEMQGEMAGRDVVNMIKATMEWVDIPLLLYTRAPLQSQKEARQIHGADDYVLKGPGSAETLVQRVIAIFRKA
jgi:CheY-like chemotaxis protein